jgi:DnaJ-class molecular chaperone
MATVRCERCLGVGSLQGDRCGRCVGRGSIPFRLEPSERIVEEMRTTYPELLGHKEPE